MSNDIGLHLYHDEAHGKDCMFIAHATDLSQFTEEQPPMMGRNTLNGILTAARQAMDEEIYIAQIHIYRLGNNFGMDDRIPLYYICSVGRPEDRKENEDEHEYES